MKIEVVTSGIKGCQNRAHAKELTKQIGSDKQ
jgi:hypothetical protein